jgi:hypothetical protein
MRNEDRKVKEVKDYSNILSKYSSRETEENEWRCHRVQPVFSLDSNSGPTMYKTEFLNTQNWRIP